MLPCLLGFACLVTNNSLFSPRTRIPPAYQAEV